MRSAVASKLRRKGRSTVTFRKPNSRFSKMRETTRFSARPVDLHRSRLAVAEVAVDSRQPRDLIARSARCACC